MVYNILDFGAKKNYDSTDSIQNAIDMAFEQGGGTVLVPAGKYIISTLQMRSNVSLYLNTGAVLECTDNFEKFKKVGYSHNEMGEVISAIYAIGQENVSICGNGKIDLNGNIFFDPTKPIIPENMVGRMNEKQISECTWHHDVRVNQPIFFLHCNNVKLEGVTITNSPSWTVTVAESEKINISHVNIKNHPNVPNNDGVHLCASKDIIISDCNFECADDTIAVSSITDWNIPSENITINNCIFRSFSKAIVLGYMQSVVRNVNVNNVIIQNSNRGLTIMASSKDGLVENVNFTNCIIDTRIRAGNWWGNGEPIFIMGTYHHNYVKDVPPRDWPVNVRNINYSSIICSAENCIGIIGENNNIENINFRDITMTLKESDNLHLKGKINDLSPSIQVETIPQDDKDYWLVVRNAKFVNFDNVKVNEFKGKIPEKFVVKAI